MFLQTQSPMLRQTTTAHMAQTMSLLAMACDDLSQKIQNALDSNPALDLIDEPRCPHCNRPLPRGRRCPICSNIGSRIDHQSDPNAPIVFVSPRSDFIGGSSVRNSLDGDEDMSPEDGAVVIEELPMYVLRQIGPELEPEDRALAAYLLTNLDEDGLLQVPLIEAARYCHAPLSRVEAVQRAIQQAEPLGVGSSSPQQAMLVQLEALAESRPVPPLAAQVIQDGLEPLSREAYAELARMLRISKAEVVEIARFITDNLNPYPARAHWGDVRQGRAAPIAYQRPDVIITCVHDGPDTPLRVEVISPYAGSLRVNPMYREAMAQATAEASGEMQSDLENASLLVKCLQQRDHTLVRLMQQLATRQRNYLLEGDAEMAPLTRAELAKELGLHESTISRAVASKAIQLPNRRIVQLARLFDRSLNVRTALAQIIAEEPYPLSDSEIAEALSQQGFDVARRTVAKYRKMEHILPARLRHKGATAKT